MSSKNDAGADSNPTTTPINAKNPTAVTKKDSNTVIIINNPVSGPGQHRSWVKRTVVGIGVAAIIMIIGTLTEIPNNVMNWFIHLREISKADNATDQPAQLAITKVWCDPLVPEVGKTLKLKVALNNIGKTPARNCVAVAVVEPVPKGHKPNFDYSKEKVIRLGFLPPNAEQYQFTLQPVKSRSTGQEGPLNQEIYEQLGSGEITLFAHGRIDYQDVTGKSHWMTFCYFQIVPFNEHFGIFSEHNEIDGPKK